MAGHGSLGNASADNTHYVKWRWLVTTYDPWGKDYRPGFSDDMKQVHGLGPVYFFRAQCDSRRLQRGFIREIDPPYRRGKGLQVRVFGNVFGIGLCRRVRYANEYEAVRDALEASDIVESAENIGDWHGDFEAKRHGREEDGNGEVPNVEDDDGRPVRLVGPSDV